MQDASITLEPMDSIKLHCCDRDLNVFVWLDDASKLHVSINDGQPTDRDILQIECVGEEITIIHQPKG